MTITQAITVLTSIANDFRSEDELQDVDACQLGIEALEWRRRCERAVRLPKLPPLPGETEE